MPLKRGIKKKTLSTHSHPLFVKIHHLGISLTHFQMSHVWVLSKMESTVAHIVKINNTVEPQNRRQEGGCAQTLEIRSSRHSGDISLKQKQLPLQQPDSRPRGHIKPRL